MDLLKIFSGWKDVVEFGPQSVIFKQGDPAEFLYVIIAGEVELNLRGESIGSEGVGGIIGESAITSSATRTATATALGDVKLARLTGYQLNMLMTKSTEFSLHVMAVLADRLRAVNHYIDVHLDSA